MATECQKIRIYQKYHISSFKNRVWKKGRLKSIDKKLNNNQMHDKISSVNVKMVAMETE